MLSKLSVSPQSCISQMKSGMTSASLRQDLWTAKKAYSKPDRIFKILIFTHHGVQLSFSILFGHQEETRSSFNG